MKAAPSITIEDKRQIVSDSVAALVRELITQHKDELDFISPAQASGILDVNPKTLSTLKIPRYSLVPNKVVKYRLSEVISFLETTKD